MLKVTLRSLSGCHGSPSGDNPPLPGGPPGGPPPGGPPPGDPPPGSPPPGGPPPGRKPPGSPPPGGPPPGRKPVVILLSLILSRLLRQPRVEFPEEVLEYVFPDGEFKYTFQKKFLDACLEKFLGRFPEKLFRWPSDSDFQRERLMSWSSCQPCFVCL